jgi:CubicO group peptidase (beta-lactamase class C family)
MAEVEQSRWSRKARDRVLRPGTPDEVGMLAERLDQASRVLNEETESGRVLAASILVARYGFIVLQRGFGKLSPHPDSASTTAATICFVASITKPFTSAALVLLAERGLIMLSDAVQKYVPEFQGEERAKVRVKDLLKHTSGLPDMLPENLELRRSRAPLNQFVRHVVKTPLLYPPGMSFGYQSMGILLAGEIVERLTRCSLREFERKEFFDPLGMNDTTLGLEGRPIQSTAWCQGHPTHAQSEEDQMVFGPNSPYWRDLGHPWGGMHSSTIDLGVFSQMFLNGGIYGGRQILSPASVEAMTSDQNRAIDSPWGLGWCLKYSRVHSCFGESSSARTFGHLGATGTVAWADPERDLLCVILTTRSIDKDNCSLLRRVSNTVEGAVR